MWTKKHRQIYRRESNGYPSDLKDAEWAWPEPLILRLRQAATTQDRHAGGDERHSLFVAHRLPMRLLAAWQLSATPDCLQNL
jgi:hypothetical protein